jgi:class 3 adenylate cyclase
MPMYMDIHEIPGATAEDVAKAHSADVETQRKYGVEYHKYWFNERSGKIFCLCSAPSPEAAASVHREAHGLLAAKIIEVAPEIAEGFLGGCEVNTAGAALVPGVAGNERDPGIRTVLFTDIVDSIALTQRLGDDAAMALLQVHDAIVRDALGAWGGREVKHTGDGIMACFLSAVAAARCATRIQRALAQHERGNRELPVKVRIGAAAGEPVENHLDLFGSTVQLAARLCSHAQPEQSLVSNVVAELCIGKDVTFQDLGEISLKGFDRPIRVHAIKQPGEAAPH